MQLIYQGVDITRHVDIVSAVHRDYSGGRSDCLDLTLDHADTWYRWKPEQDDVIEFRHGGYTTGALFLNTIAPERDSYRILATSTRSSARRKAWASYEGKSLSEIFKALAAESQMGSKIYGLDEKIAYPYLLRKDESCAAFLNRLMYLEGAVLKTVSGRYTAISVETAQNIQTSATIEIESRQPGVTYRKRENMRHSGLMVKTPYATASAYDTAVTTGDGIAVCDLPAIDNVTAGRWARGMLLMNNRQSEELTIAGEFNIGFTAMCRIDVKSSTDMNGEWICDEVEHDFVKKSSRAKLLRCVRTVK